MSPLVNNLNPVARNITTDLASIPHVHDAAINPLNSGLSPVRELDNIPRAKIL